MIFQNIKIICGGQSGVDRAALDFALENGMPCGGWCPFGRLAEDGIIPDTYPLKESVTTDYEERTKLNVRDSDGVIIMYQDEMDKGTQLTINIAHSKRIPLLEINLKDYQTNIKEVLNEWLIKNKILILNIAGPRESSTPGIYNDTKSFLDNLLEQ